MNDKDLFDKIISIISPHYNGLNRHYHNYKHIMEVYNDVYKLNIGYNEKFPMLLAALFHDVVYDVNDPKNNEERSILFFKRFVEEYFYLFSPDEDIDFLIQEVSRFIMATKDYPIPKRTDELIFRDIDRKILKSKDFIELMKWENGIRKEYSNFSDNDYIENRSKFLLKNNMEFFLSYLKDNVWKKY